MPIRTKLTQLLGLKHPIVQGGMMWVGRAPLAAAVSNAGGLGILTGLTQPTPEALRDEIRNCRAKLTANQPFGVNLTFLPTISPPPYKEYAQVIIDEKVPVVETAGNNPGEFIEMFKRAGIFTIHKCVAVRHAMTAERIGVDMVSMDGFECAGHPGMDELTLMILLAKSSKKLKIPFLASGGMGDGQGLAAALALGAEGINMGTRFVATKEAPVHNNIKQALVDGDERNTALIYRPLRNTARVYKNKPAVQVNEIEKEKQSNLVFEDIQPLVAGNLGRQAMESGEIDAGIWTAGPVMGLIDDVPTCQELLDRIVKEAEDIVREKLVSRIY
ncbi:2-nitropropane dioxygenase [Hesseltinella vesiculosa]|uniref:2-nitropropane dioxygenase n=1 Tax=Hesseltinella vesiculosa TaxID=101127 RepID=A0A1X2GEE8_9FUNG|nr:2-nitropropane dioxygenase [Hesseltinella vesiculosa]